MITNLFKFLSFNRNSLFKATLFEVKNSAGFAKQLFVWGAMIAMAVASAWAFPTSAFGQIGVGQTVIAVQEGPVGGSSSSGSGSTPDPNESSMGADTGNLSAIFNRPKMETAGLKALIYKDTVRVVRYDFQRIDFEGTATFAEDIVQAAIGSLDLEDRYLVKLRENQKASLKTAFRDVLDKMQNNYEKNLLANGIEEYYQLRYVTGSEYCNCYAFPIAGITEPQYTALVSYVSREYSPVYVFERFEFLIVVDDHSSSTAAVGTKVEEEEEEEEENMSGDSMGGGGTGRASSATQAAATRARKLKDAKKLAMRPAILKRFSTAANEKSGDAVIAALTATNGAALTYVMKDAEAILDMLTWIKTNGLELPLDDIQKNLESNKGKIKWATFNLSFVNEPRAIILVSCADGAMTALFAPVINGALAAAKGAFTTKLNEQMKSLELDTVYQSNPFIPMVEAVIDSMKAKSKGNQVAIELKFGELLKKANVFVPLLGGVPAEVRKTKKDDEIEFDESEEESDSMTDSNDTEPNKKTPQKKENEDPFEDM